MIRATRGTRNLRLRACAGLLLPLLASGCGGGGGGGGNTVDFTVAGTLHYEDRTYGSKPTAFPLPYGFVGIVENPVRHATVQVTDGTGEVVATGATDGAGHYSVSGQAAEGGTFYVRVLADTADSYGVDVSVRNLSSELFAASKSFQVTAGANTVDATVTIGGDGTGAAGAFNILDVYTAAGEFLHATQAAYPPALKAYWQPGNTEGTRFCTPVKCGTNTGIYILGGGPAIEYDTDEFDDDVLWHEYGHFLESVAGALDSPGGLHTLADSAQDLRLAWSEGWSNYVSGAAKQWLADNAPGVLSISGLPVSFYIDTSSDDAMLTYDFATVPTGGTVSYATSETSVAKLLWDINATVDHAAIWDVVAATMAVSAHPSSLETFWDGWLTMHPEDKEAVQPLLRERLIDYTPDAHEPGDDTVATVRPTYAVAETHNLYRDDVVTEIDLVPLAVIAGKTYRLETYDLRNGTDTYVRILWPDGSAMADAGNDNWSPELNTSTAPDINDGCKLASRVQFTATGSGTLFAEVTRSPSLPAAAGRYGEYKLAFSEAGSVGLACE